MDGVIVPSSLTIATSPKISEKPDPKRTSGARVAFSTSSQPIFAAEPQAVPA